MPKAYLGLGSNIGNRESYLRAATKMLKANNYIDVKKISGVYESNPLGYTNQRAFLNTVVEIETSFSAVDLFKVCQLIEEFLKRKRDIKCGPRTIDLDILLYGNKEINTPNLTIPHPEMTKRNFVLVPLLEIAPHAKFPNGDYIADYLGVLSPGGIERKGNLVI